MKQNLKNTGFAINMFSQLISSFCFLGNSTNAILSLPELPHINAEEYAKKSEKEKAIMIREAINNDPFWSKFIKKLKDKNSHKSLIEATKEIDIQIKELTEKRWEIIKNWVLE